MFQELSLRLGNLTLQRKSYFMQTAPELISSFMIGSGRALCILSVLAMGDSEAFDKVKPLLLRICLKREIFV